MARLTSRRFNEFHDQIHSETIRQVHEFTKYAVQIIVNGNIKNNSIAELKSIYQKIKFTEYYLKHWPGILAECLSKKPEMDNFITFMQAALGVDLWDDSSNAPLYQDWKGIPGLLVMESHIIFDALFFGKPKHLDFHLVLYETMWVYLSVRNSSFKLPPLESIYYLHVNTELYEKEISNLNTLHDEYGLIVWDPSLLQPKWSSHYFYEHVNMYLVFSKSCNPYMSDGFESEFMSYLQVSFVLKMLEQNEYDFGHFADIQHHLFDYFELIIRGSVHYLWMRQYLGVLDQFLLALHDNNALGLLHSNSFLMKLSSDSNVTESFVGILVELCHFNISLGFAVCKDIAKSIYFWFIQNDKESAMILISNLHNRSFLHQKVLDVLISFLEEPIFHFVSNESKGEYLKELPRRKTTMTDKPVK